MNPSALWAFVRIRTRKLRALIRVDDFRGVVAVHCLLPNGHIEIRIHGVRHARGEHRSAMSVQNRRKVQEIAPHGCTWCRHPTLGLAF